jgi:hypothetical protein
MRDVTPYLMGDPVASDRRPPTEQEMAKNCQFNRLEFKVRERRTLVTRHPRSQLLNLPVGGWVIKPTKKGAVSAMKHMRTYGLQCHCIPTSEGKYQVIRTA